MKLFKRCLVIVCLILLVSIPVKTVMAEKAATDKPVIPTSEKDKVSYAIGVNMAASLIPIKDEIDLQTLKKGFDDKMTDQPLLISEDDARTILKDYYQKMKAKQAQAKAEANLIAGWDFLDENAKKEGIITTDSGLQYMVAKKGKGPLPKATDTVKVNYEGTTIDGRVFDSSYRKKEPATFDLIEVIPGWQEALLLMPVGSKYKLFIPSELAYGEIGSGGRIEPNSVLIFDVELLDIVKAKDAKAAEQ